MITRHKGALPREVIIKKGIDLHGQRVLLHAIHTDGWLVTVEGEDAKLKVINKIWVKKFKRSWLKEIMKTD